MSKGGGGQTYALPVFTSSNSTTSIPGWLTNASQTGINAAQKLLNNPGQAYTGTLVPGMTGDQQAAGNLIRNNVGAYQGYYDRAADLTDAATQAGPAVQAQTFRNGLSGIGDYMDPYIGQVIGGLRQNAADALSDSLTQTADQAISAKAFGGSRHGVREGVATASVNKALNNQIGELLSGGYNRATQLLGQDISNDMQAQGANQSAFANYMNRLLGAGNQMASVGTANRAANTADINNLLTYGGMEQGTATQQAQAQYQEFLRQQNLPYQALQAYGGMVAAAPHDKSTNSSGWQMGPQQQQSSSPLATGLGLGLTGLSLFNPGSAGSSAIGNLAGWLGGGLLK